MEIFSLFLLFNFRFMSEAGVTEISPDTSDDAMVETITEETWMPANIFDVQGIRSVKEKETPNLLENESPWSAESSPIFRAIRDFIFQTGDELVESIEKDSDPTDELASIIERGLIEATTIFLTPSDEQLTVSSTDSLSILRIENDINSPMLDRIGFNFLENQEKGVTALSITNITTSCSNCHNELESCVQQCFVAHNCLLVERQVRQCPQPSGALCNIFLQWSPEDECKVNEDCKSPLLCCSDGCSNKCLPGIWQN